MSDEQREESPEDGTIDERTFSRRSFLIGAKGWSAAVAALALTMGPLAGTAEAGWLNSGGGWVNRGGSWVNRRGGGGWVNRAGGGGWVNRAGGGGWLNGGGGGWVNRGGSWVNRRGGGSWINRR